MSILHRSLPYLCFLASGVFLLRGVKLLITSALYFSADAPSSAYEHGYTFGQVAVAILFIASAAGFVAIGRRKLRAKRSRLLIK